MSHTTMHRKRPRPLSSAQPLVAVVATFATLSPLSSQGFVTPGVASLFAADRKSNKASTTAVAGRLQADPRRIRRRQVGLRRRQPNDFHLDPDDPLPRTMEELYKQIASQPPTNPEEQYKKALEPGPEDMVFVEDAVRTTFKCTEDDAWWETNEAEWDRMAENPAMSFAVGRDEDEWGMEDYFGEETPAWKPSDDVASYSLGAYKAGISGAGAGAGGNPRGSTDASELFALTPFGQYWESVPDLGTTRRVYAYNAADRMGALKFMMNFTYNGMHGPAESLQSGHFLWGYVDQLDWMRRSGRLSSTPGSIKVDPSSWWGRVSYALTIIPLAAAVECGAAVSILGLGGGSGGDSSDSDRQGQRDDLQLPELRRAVRAWKRVWSFSDPDIAARVQLNMPVHDSLQERVRRAQWAAHLESLDAVDALYGEEFDKLPSDAEREFARGWCRAARLFSEASAHTNLDRCLLPLGAGYAPERMLTGDDGSAVAGDATEEESSGALDSSSDLAVVALKTRRCVASVRWLGTLRAPVFGALLRLWRRSCGSYPARREAARVLRRACYGGRRAKAAAWAKSFLFMFVPDLNYRKLSFPLGIDPAEHVEYDPGFNLADVEKPPPRRAGSRPSNPLQWPWYDGRKPDPSAGTPAGAGWGEDDDGLLGGSAVVGGMFPRGREPVDRSFEALQRIEREIMRDLRAAKEHYDEMKSSEGNSDEDINSRSSETKHRRRQGEEGADDAASGAGAETEGGGESAKSPKTVFM